MHKHSNITEETMTMNTDLFFPHDGITPLSQAGIDYVRALQAKAYLEAWNKGLTMQFDSKSTLDVVTDPGSTSHVWNPMPVDYNNPGYSDDALPMNVDPRDCDADDDPDAARCGESESFGE